jgi:DNA (cytosine-5)-methyltransferase 1
MRYYSVFSGVEAATLAWEPLGWEPACFCEVDEFPSAVLRERWPDVPNLGDITMVNWKRVVREYGAADLVVGGSPCQSFSIAGNRTGLDGASGLMWEYVRCVREVRPRWFVWENVPGALSSSHGEDFGCLLRSMDELGYGLAWSVLDAQFAGVPQRRRRVFLVGSLGDRRSAEVLFEPESLRWDTPSSREKRKELAGGAGGSAEASGFRWHQGSGAGAIGYEPEQSPTLDTVKPPAICMTDTQPHAMVDGEVCGALSATMHKDPPVVAKTLKMRGGCEGGGKGPLVQDDMSATLGTGNDQTLFEPVSFAANQRGELRLQGGDGTVVGAIPASQSGKQVQGVMDGYVVRRLTPRECERLQGMPDDHTRIPYRGKPAEECPDTPRYKAIGNSMAVPVMRWIGERIAAVDATLPWPDVP